jgi:uncharacterized RDD family membrane protein YckC
MSQTSCPRCQTEYDASIFLPGQTFQCIHCNASLVAPKSLGNASPFASTRRLDTAVHEPPPAAYEETPTVTSFKVDDILIDDDEDEEVVDRFLTRKRMSAFRPDADDWRDATHAEDAPVQRSGADEWFDATEVAPASHSVLDGLNEEATVQATPLDKGIIASTMVETPSFDALSAVSGRRQAQGSETLFDGPLSRASSSDELTDVKQVSPEMVAALGKKDALDSLIFEDNHAQTINDPGGLGLFRPEMTAVDEEVLTRMPPPGMSQPPTADLPPHQAPLPVTQQPTSKTVPPPSATALPPAEHTLGGTLVEPDLVLDIGNQLERPALPFSNEEAPERPLASIKARAIACLIDSALFYCLFSVLLWGAQVGLVRLRLLRHIQRVIPQPLHQFVSVFLFLVVGLALFSVCHLLFYAIPYKWKGVSLGKWLQGIEVRSTRTGGHLTVMQALMREGVGKVLSSLLLGGGFLVGVMREDRQGLHDMLFGTKVVERQVSTMPS